ncbi:AMP-dependent synthetase/ligase [Bowmanella denitrificans]|uniref:AMP-dependent synthetase/ligase n=1 Tax=Bowmanella denitrificans TaxID=366582 RepID=A0ABN0XNC8_9ALTE
MWFFTDNTRLEAQALCDGITSLTYGQLAEQVALRSAWLKAQEARHVALALDNGIEWVLMDLACQQAGICCVPVPVFFSQSQLSHLLNSAAIDLLITPAQPQSENLPFGTFCWQRLMPELVANMPKETGKITFTSGSTGTPKGVCLSHAALQKTAQSIVGSLAMQNVVHLCLLPLATLLENIAGVYAPLLAGGKVIVPNDAQRGGSGSQLQNIQTMLALISQWQPTSVILVPELLNVLVQACAQGWQPPSSLQFIAVGGAKVAPALLAQASALGLPVYQGYGLSECVSVVALNTPDCHRIDSVGKPLAHNRLSIENDEIVVRGNLFLGYLNEPDSWYPTQVHTGDKGKIEDGFVCIDGRMKNLLINSFGRNISPEWVEAELLASGLFRHVMLFGDNQPFCAALLIPVRQDLPDTLVSSAIEQVNARLPDYAKVRTWQRLNASDVAGKGVFTANGKLKRSAICTHFQAHIDALFKMETSTGACHEAV